MGSPKLQIVTTSAALTKRDLLAFDEIFVMDLERQLEHATEGQAADLLYLMNEGVVRRAPTSFGELRGLLGEQEEPLRVRVPARPGLFPVGDMTSVHYVDLGTVGIGIRARNFRPETVDLQIDLSSVALPPDAVRLVANVLSSIDPSNHCIPFIRPVSRGLSPAQVLQSYANFSVDSGRTSEASAIGSWTSRLGFSLDVQLIPAPASDEPASEHAILDVVFHSLPIPTEDVSLEELLLFKRDENHRLRRLVIWLLRQIRKEVDADLLRLEIEEMIASYSAEMQVHRITHEIGTLRTLVSVPLEVVQALIRLKPKDALDALYSVRLHKAALTAAEAKAPGKEVAYVAVARERYSSYPV